MRSQLTKGIFRAIIANRPYCTSTARSAIQTSTTSRLSRTRSPTLQHRRRLFGWGKTSQPQDLSDLKAQLTRAGIEGARDKLVDIVKARRDRSLLPPVEQIVKAFRLLLPARWGTNHAFERTDVYLLTEGLKHIQAQPDPPEQPARWLADEDLSRGILTLAGSLTTDKFRTDSTGLARLMFEEWEKRGSIGEGHPPTVAYDVYSAYLTILCSSGSSLEAWDALRKSKSRRGQKLWASLLCGLSNEGRSSEISQALREMTEREGPLLMEIHRTIALHFAERDHVGDIKLISEQVLANDALPSLDSQIAILRFWIRQNDLGPAKDILAHLRSVAPLYSRVWGVLLVATVAEGGGIDECMSTFDRLGKTAKRPVMRPAMTHLNSVFEYLFSVGNVQAVEECLQKARSRGLEPNARTYLLHLDYEIRTQQLEKAVESYDKLASQDPVTGHSDIPVLNRLLAALCFSPNPRYDYIIQLTDLLTDRRAVLEAEALGGLCKVLLERDEINEVLDVLQQRIDSYPVADRARVAKVFKHFICDENIPAQRAFNAYELYQTAFPEAPVADRLVVMHSFFARKRPDFGCMVFGHMRQRDDATYRPTAEAYGQCYEGIASCQDLDGLQMVYNMLKLDREVDPNTRVRNGLMAAYTACGQPFNSIIDHYWKILSSKQGPTMSTFALALRACEAWVPQGALEARRIIAMMQAWGLEINKEIYDSYVGAIAGQCEFENTVELIEEMETDLGISPDAFTIGTFYNAIPWQFRKDEVEAWARRAYPDLWEDLLKFGDYIDVEWEVRYFKLNRTIDTSDDLLFSDGEYDPQIARSAQGLLDAPL